jgi:hypothetical protein
MADLDDYEFEGSDAAQATSRSRTGGGGPMKWILGTIVVMAMAGAAFWYLRQQPQAPPAPAPSPAITPSPAPSPTPAIPLPSLDQSDAFVRTVAQILSPHPQWELWLKQSDLIRRFVAVVESVTEGDSPRQHLGFLSLKGPFGVKQERRRIVIDPQSFARYDAIVDGFESLDAAGCAGVFKVLQPLLATAYREKGYPEGDIAAAVENAIQRLLRVPIVPETITVKPAQHSVVRLYEYADPALESLSPAQKHLLRMGPRNVGRVQAKLRELGAALGMKLG